MSKQISLTLPDGLFKTMKRRSKEHGYRSLQEYLLECARERIFLDNLPEYEKIAKEMENQPTMTKRQFLAWLRNPK